MRLRLPSLSAPPRPGGVREVWRIAAPVVISTASFTVMQFVDRLFLAWHSEVSLRAALPAGMLALTLTMFFQALAGYSGTFVAQYHGAGRIRECARATAQGIWIGLLTWPLAFILIPLGFWLMSHAGHPPDMLAEERIYFSILMLGCGMMGIQNALAGFFAGRGDTRTPMLINLLANAINITLDYALIFGRWGFPRWGIAGAAAATLAAAAFATLLLALAYLRPRWRHTCGTLTEWRPRLPDLRSLCRFGIPGAFHSVLDTGSFAFFLVVIGRLPATDYAANNIAFSVNNVAFMPLMGMSIAAQILVGQYQGARQPDLAARSAFTALKMAWIYMFVASLSFLLFPRFYFSLFTGDAPGMVHFADVFTKGRWLLVLLGLWGMLDTVNIVLNGALKGAGDTRFVLIYATLFNWGAWIPGTLLILHHFGDRALLPVWLWMMLFIVLFASGFWIRFRRGRWKRIQMLSPT